MLESLFDKVADLRFVLESLFNIFNLFKLTLLKRDSSVGVFL